MHDQLFVQSINQPLVLMLSLLLKIPTNGLIVLFHRGKSSSAAELVLGNNSVKNPPISSMEDDDMMDKEEESDDVSDRDGMEQAITHTSSQPLHHSKDPYPHKNKIPNSSSDRSQVC
jgi:hypothetical protein